MWPQLDEHSLRLDEWLNLDENPSYDGPLSPAGESDSTADSLLSTPSPPLNMRDLLVDSEDYGPATREYRVPFHDGRLFSNNPVGAFDRAYFGGGSRFLETTSGRHEIGRVGSSIFSARQHRIHRQDPYRRPSQGPSHLAAPHSDQVDMEAQDYREQEN
ncbi:hypothetical protein B0H11DRAFT_1192386 [Mycena galericulata]|nr:hypothetical protein B0H11DRAFT_1192386 [Mycena galericulata]